MGDEEADWDVSGDINWDDWGDDEGGSVLGGPCVDLFSPTSYDNAALALEAMKASGFDFLRLARSHQCDQYGCIRLINYVRRKVLAEPEWRHEPKPEDYASEEFYLPVLEDDGLLQFDFETALGIPDTVPPSNEVGADKREPTVQQLQVELQQLKDAFAQYRELAEPALLGSSDIDVVSDADVASDPTVDTDEDPPESDDVESYFYSYAHFGIHLEMLQDKVRTQAYRDSMYQNPETYKGKTVLDVGCGTGILSMFAAKTGAAKVIGVDNSSVLHRAMGIVLENGFKDEITLIRGKVEEIELPVEKVDIIVSEWMGCVVLAARTRNLNILTYFLFFESMLDSVIFARDKWLKPGGAVYPDKCSLYITAVANPSTYQRRVSFWQDVYGFNMASMAPQVLREVDVHVVDPESVVSAPSLLKKVDIMVAKVDELEFDSAFELTMTRDCTVDALCSYFDVDFEHMCAKPVKLPTGPHTTPTHWKQAVFFLEKPATVPKGGVLEGRMSGRRSSYNSRHWDATVTYSVKGSDAPAVKQQFTLG